jgi:hypothetical protein
LQHAEEEPLDLAGSDRLEVLCDQIDMPILEVDRGRLRSVPGVGNVEAQTVREHDPVATKSLWVARGLGFERFVVRRRRLDVGVSVVGSNGHRGCGFNRGVQAFAGGIEGVINARLLLA